MENINALMIKLEKAKTANEAMKTLAKYPTGIIIDLASPEGNVFHIMGVCQQLGKKLDLPEGELAAYHKACQNSYYKDILNISQEWFGLIYINA